MAEIMDDGERDSIVNSLNNELHILKEQLRERDCELVKLHREIHKLKVRKGGLNRVGIERERERVWERDQKL